MGWEVWGGRMDGWIYAADASYAVFSFRGFLKHDVGFVGAEVEFGLLGSGWVGHCGGDDGF